MSQILAPPKVYLDTGHLINIARLRRGEPIPNASLRDAYTTLDSYIVKKHFGLIYNPAAPLDWVDGKATFASASEIADVIQSAKLQYYFIGDPFIYTAEVFQELNRIAPTVTVPTLAILQPILPNEEIAVALGVLAKLVPNFLTTKDLQGVRGGTNLPEKLRLPTFRAIVKETFNYRDKRRSTYDERVEGFKAAMSNDIKHLVQIPKEMAELRIQWMDRFLRLNPILTALNPNISPNDLLATVDVERCPAMRLWFLARYRRIKAGFPAKDNDVDDWGSLPVAPYADLMLTERHLREFIIQADPSFKKKVTADPSEALQILSQWT